MYMHGVMVKMANLTGVIKKSYSTILVTNSIFGATIYYFKTYSSGNPPRHPMNRQIKI
jgi:hypothetical protein